MAAASKTFHHAASCVAIAHRGFMLGRYCAHRAQIKQVIAEGENPPSDQIWAARSFAHTKAVHSTSVHSRQ